MTSPSSQKMATQNPLSKEQQQNVETHVNAALDKSVEHLSDQALADIRSVRHAALNALQQQQNKAGFVERFGQMIMQPFAKVALPVAAAVLIALSLNHNSMDPVPALPIAMINEDVPTEDLALLEDLEFVSWLAENEQDVLL